MRVFITWERSGDVLFAGRVGEGDGIGSSSDRDSIGDIIAECLVRGDVILNLREALEEQIRRKGWLGDVMRSHPEWDQVVADWVAWNDANAANSEATTGGPRWKGKS